MHKKDTPDIIGELQTAKNEKQTNENKWNKWKTLHIEADIK